jgi:hypothetical protein
MAISLFVTIPLGTAGRLDRPALLDLPGELQADVPAHRRQIPAVFDSH